MLNGCSNIAVGCLLATHLPVKAELRRRPDLAGHPLLVVSGQVGPAAVLDASPEALSAGVRVGSRLAEALATCGDAVVTPLDESYLAEVNAEFLSALSGVFDRVEAAGGGTFYLDLSGMLPLYPGWRLRLGLGPGKFPAWCAARLAPAGDFLAAPNDVTAWLAPLPLSWLPLPADALARLSGFGARTIGDLAAMPVSALGDFLGADGLRARRLAF